MSRTPLIEWIIKNQYVLIQVDFVKEIFMIPDRLTASHKTVKDEKEVFSIDTLSPLYTGKLFVYENRFYAVNSFERVDNRLGEFKTYSVYAEPLGINHDPKDKFPLLTPQHSFMLEAGEILNYREGGPIDTTIGIFIANYLFLVYPAGSVIDYVNGEFFLGLLESKISKPILTGEISVRDVKDKYVDTLSLFGQSNEIFCPNITEKTITVPQEITDLRERLVLENKEALEAGDASVMSDIEQTLIKAFKTYLKGDSSLHFLLKSKYWNVTLKKLLLTQGMTEVFGSPGKFTFVANPMGNGWKQEDLPAIFNEVRKGSYSRAMETADGGVIAKLILRVLQDTRITIDDCGTKKGEHVHGTKNVIDDFQWNYVIETNGSLTLITEDNHGQFLGKDLVIRTPGYCQAEEGFCSKCFGYLFEEIGQKAFAPIANEVARFFLVQSLKSMHGTSHQTKEIDDINLYLI